MKNPEELKLDLKAGLYLVSTPIGNLSDITIRALDILKSVDLILCEDKRVSGKLLKAYDIRCVLGVYNDHSDADRRGDIIRDIKNGKAVAMVSDAGTPMICDPGYKLVQKCYEEDIYVTSLPGANAPLTALQLSGMQSDSFSFLGFLPSKSKARCDYLERWMAVRSVLIAFETGPRLIKSLQNICDVMGNRDVAVVREITKLYEEVRRDAVMSLLEHYSNEGAPKGEIVLVISPAHQDNFSDDEVDHMIRKALLTMRSKDASVFVAGRTGLKKSDLYNRVLKIENED